MKLCSRKGARESLRLAIPAWRGGSGEQARGSGCQAVQVSGKERDVSDVVRAGQAAGPAFQADRESAVRRHAVGKGFKVAGVAGGVFAPCADRGEVVGVTVQPLPAGDEFQTAEEQVEAVG